MCGIHACITTQASVVEEERLLELLKNRGPDHIGHESVQVNGSNGLPYFIHCTSTVLALRGGQVTCQPFNDPQTKSIFCWNGEAWKLDQRPVNDNDGQAIFDLLLKASAQVDAADAMRDILQVLRAISGPFAFFFFDYVHARVYFGRDRLGRRSLLVREDVETLEFASISNSLNPSWVEVEADGIYSLILHPSNPVLSDPSRADGRTQFAAFEKHTWDTDTLNPLTGIFNKSPPSEPLNLTVDSECVRKLSQGLRASLKLRVLDVPVPPGFDQRHKVRIGILFSGGLDCTVLARLTHDILPLDQQIDLINVAFENPRVIEAAKNASSSKKNRRTVSDETRTSLIEPDYGMEASPYESCPDRETGRKALQELKTVCPGRVWRFVAVNVPYEGMLAHRTSVIELIHPHNTEMDLSIANALYFAARGIGVCESDDGTLEYYATSARVLLSGLGADELFGGYTRHATAFSRRGYEGLLDELELDVNRLGKRNLGRDDRVISHWGKEARFPYLDESFVKWAVECPIWEKCGFQIGQVATEEPEIEPGKKILRLLAYSLGMHSVAVEKKRAIQFGARTAKMEVGRTKGTQLIS